MTKRKLILVVSIFLLLLAGCKKKNDDKDLTKLNPKVDTCIGSATVSWEVPLNLETAEERYHLSCYAVTQKNEKVTNDKLIFEQELTIPYFNGNDWIAYYCQENEYFGDFRYEVEAYVEDEHVASGISEVFNGETIFPKEKLLEYHNLEITSFEYSGSADHVEGNFNFTVSINAENILLNATFFDATIPDVRQVTDQVITLEEWEGLRKLMSGGTLSRRVVLDPELQLLDGSETSIRLQWVNQTNAEMNYFRFYPNNNEEEIHKYLLDLCK